MLFSGDAVLGHGSVYVAPDPGALRGYLAALDRLLGLDLDLICPGHFRRSPSRARSSPSTATIASSANACWSPRSTTGCAAPDDLLDRAWSDVPAVLRPAAAVTLAAHLDTLAEEDRLPADVDRDGLPRYGGRVMPTEQKVTFCRICEAHCGMVATVDAGVVTKLRPDRDHPLARVRRARRASR